jgi:hypothetical protein
VKGTAKADYEKLVGSPERCGGYLTAQIEGQALHRQLRALIRVAQASCRRHPTLGPNNFLGLGALKSTERARLAVIASAQCAASLRASFIPRYPSVIESTLGLPHHLSGGFQPAALADARPLGRRVEPLCLHSSSIRLFARTLPPVLRIAETKPAAST